MRRGARISAAPQVYNPPWAAALGFLGIFLSPNVYAWSLTQFAAPIPFGGFNDTISPIGTLLRKAQFGDKPCLFHPRGFAGKFALT